MMPMNHLTYRELTGSPFSNGKQFHEEDCLTFLNGLPWPGLRGCRMSAHREPRHVNLHGWFGDPNHYLRVPEMPQHTEYSYEFDVVAYAPPSTSESRANWFSYLTTEQGRKMKLITFDSISLELHIDGHLMNETMVEARVTECHDNLMYELHIIPSLPLERVTNHLYFLFLSGGLRDYLRNHSVPEARTVEHLPHQRPLRRALPRRLPEPARGTLSLA